jgi:hypothetical protein
MGAWLRDNGLDGNVAQERYRLLLILENLTAIEAWRADLTEAKRRKLNHPNSIWHTWRRATSPPSPRVLIPRATPKMKNRYHAPVRWPQDMVRRGAMAMREHWSNDTFALARICLMAALPHEGCFADLLPAEPPPPKPAPCQSAAPAALELSA